MRLILASCALALALSGCNEPAVNVTPQQAVEAVTAVNAIEATGTNYLRLPLCPQPAGNLCRTQAASADVATGVRALYGAKNTVLAYLRANPGQPIPVTLTGALTGAVVGLQAIYAKYGVAQ